MDGPIADRLLEAAVMEAEGDERRWRREGYRPAVRPYGSTSVTAKATARGILSSSYHHPPKFGLGMTEAGGAMDVESDGKGEEATPRRILSSSPPSSQRPPNSRKKFHTPESHRPYLAGGAEAQSREEVANHTIMLTKSQVHRKLVKTGEGASTGS